MFKRVRLVLAAWFTFALVATLVVVGVVAFTLIRNDIDREIDESLEVSRDLVMREFDEPEYRDDGGPPQRPRDRDYDGPGPSPDARAQVPADVFVIFTTADGTVTDNFRQVDVDGIEFDELCDEATAGDARAEVSAANGSYRFISEASPVDGEYIHIGRSLEARDRQLRTLSMVFASGGVGGLLLAAGGGLWLAGRALRPIKESFERQRQFVSDASHELRTPLAVLRANGELLQRHRAETIDANIDQVDAITAEAEAMTRLVEDLLTLARADEEQADIANERVPLGALLEDLGRDMEALAVERGLSLRVDAHPVEVDGDRLRLRQLATILLDNAMKYTPAGGSISVSARQAGKTVEISVADTGPGISAEAQEHIFDRFVRGDAARNRAAGGTGLGLAIARWITDAHGGRISVESKPGAGSKFIVRLPASD